MRAFTEAGVKIGNAVLQDLLTGANPPELKIRGLVCMPGYVSLLYLKNTYSMTTRLFISSSKYWVTRSLSLLKEKIQKYKTTLAMTRTQISIAFLDCCAFWEDALSIILPVGDFLEGLRTWGAALFTELTRVHPRSGNGFKNNGEEGMQSSLSRNRYMGQIAAGLREIAFDIDPFANDHLGFAARQKLERKVSLLCNVIGELALLHDRWVGCASVEAEHDRMLNYQVAVL